MWNRAVLVDLFFIVTILIQPVNNGGLTTKLDLLFSKNAFIDRFCDIDKTGIILLVNWKILAINTVKNC